MRLRATRLSATGNNFIRRTGSALKRAAAAIRAASRQSVIPALPIMDGKGHWWLDRNRTQPFDPSVDLEKPIEWIDDLTGNPVGWELGPERIANGTFDSGTTAWLASGATIAVVSGELEITRNGSGQFAYQQITTTPGATCRITVRARNGTTFGSIFVGTSLGGVQLLSSQSLSSADAKSFTVWFVAASTTAFVQISLAALGTSYIDNISVREVIRDESWLGTQVFSSFTTQGTWTGSGPWSITSAPSQQDLRVDYGGVTTKTFEVIISTGAVSGGSLVVFPLSTTPDTLPASATTRIVVTSNVGFFIIRAAAGVTAVVNSVSVREIPGNHLVSPSAGTGPRATARVNLLQRTEDLTHAAWIKTNATVSGVDTAIASANSGGRVSQSFASQPLAAGWCICFELKQGTATKNRVLLRDVTNNGNFIQATEITWSVGVPVVNNITAGTWATPLDMGDGWYRFTATGTGPVGSTPTIDLQLFPDSLAGTGSVRIRKTDLRLSIHTTSAYPAYQRVGDGTAGVFDYDATGFPVWLNNDGTRGLMTLGAVDMAGTDQGALLTVVTKLSNATAVIAETSPDSATTGGSIAVYGFSTGDYRANSAGSTVRTAISAVATAPDIASLIADANILGPTVGVTRNNDVRASNLNSQGTGNYGNHRFNVFGRDVGGTPSLRFVGRALPPALLDMSVIDLATAQAMLREYASSVGHTY